MVTNRRVHISWVMIVPALGLTCAAVAAEPVTLDRVEQVVGQIVSPVTKAQQAGQQWLKANDAAVFALLVNTLEKGDAKTRMRAAHATTVIVSPWARGVAAERRHHGQIELFKPRRPTGRPTAHRHAAEIRKAALAGLRASIAQLAEAAKANANAKVPGFPTWETINTVRALSGCLAEIADDDTVKQLVALLAEQDNRFVIAYMLDSLDTVYGLPRSFYLGGICGNSTPAEIEQFARAQDASARAARTNLLKWFKAHAAKSPHQRINATLDTWDKQITDTTASTSGQTWLTQYLAPMIRLGKPAVPLIEKRKAAATSTNRKGVYEVALAAINGKVDKALIRTLLKGDRNQQMLACEIIAAGDSKDWMTELANMQVNPGAPQLKASHTLAVVHRKAAIKFLKHANEGNYVATCAIKELESWDE